MSERLLLSTLVIIVISTVIVTQMVGPARGYYSAAANRCRANYNWCIKRCQSSENVGVCEATCVSNLAACGQAASKKKASAEAGSSPINSIKGKERSNPVRVYEDEQHGNKISDSISNHGDAVGAFSGLNSNASGGHRGKH